MVGSTNISSKRRTWQDTLRETLPVFGHRNWIVLADAAYPSQSRNGIVTLIADEDHIQALHALLADIRQSKHIRPNIYFDKELEFVNESDAPGVGSIREALRSALADYPRQQIPHEEIIAKLDRAAAMFHILIVKTRLAIPYTSVFFELECGYWTDAAEHGLRQSIPGA
jgi:L-fucose mutarotase/ribose pyranase (RbsD/FucU family)